MTKQFSSEAELQKHIEDAVTDERFLEAVIDTANIAVLAERDTNIAFPQFSIDHLSRLKAIDAGASVLKALSFPVLLTSDQNISVTKGERLRPDLVCMNPEQESVILFELKKSSQTGREALTELLAYEQELKNLMPLLSNYDFNFVLISPEWSTLMDHAVSGAIAWSDKKILCLKPKLADGGSLELQTYLPTAWKVTGAVHLPEEALPCVTLCLYRKDAYAKASTEEDDKDRTEEDAIDIRIITALEVMAREGDRMGTHGFALLWKDYSNISLTDYNITICGIAPMQLYKMSRKRGNISYKDGKLVSKLDDYLAEYDPMGHSDSLIKVAKSAYALLEEVSDPKLEGFHFWHTEESALRRRAMPLMCEFWGSLGDYSRQYVMHPAVRTHRRGTFDPEIGIPLMRSFRQPTIFHDGNVRCSDAFSLGRLLGLDRILRKNIKANDNLNLRCLYEWNRIELMTVIDEVRMLADAAQNVKAPEKSFKFYSDPLADDEDDHERFMTWLIEEFFQNAMTHLPFFLVGYEGSYLFEQRDQGEWISDPPTDLLIQLEPDLRTAFLVVYSYYRRLHEEGGFWGELESHYEALNKAFRLPENFEIKNAKSINSKTLLDGWSVLLEASKHLIEPVFHKHAPVALANLDWVWMKQGISEMRERGELNPGVILLPNGQIVTGSTTPDIPGFKMHVDDPDTQVIFLDQSNGIGHSRVVSWSELESGKFFAQSQS